MKNGNFLLKTCPIRFGTVKKLIPFIIILFISISSVGQDNYLLDSVFSVHFFAPSFSINTQEKNFYNDQNQIIKKKSEFSYSLFSYHENEIQEDKYFDTPIPYLYNRIITTLNKDGFRIHLLDMAYENEAWVPTRIDSIIRDSDNNIIENYRFVTSDSQSSEALVLNSLITYAYDKRNNLIEQKNSYYNLSDGTLNFQFNRAYEYNQNDLLVYLKQEFIQNNTVSQDNISQYYYKNGSLDYVTEERTQNGTSFSTRKEYTYDYPFMTINHFYINRDDGSKTNFQTDNYSRSTSPYFDFDTIQKFSHNLDHSFLGSETINHQRINDARDSIEIRYISKSFDLSSGAFLNFHFERAYYVKKKNLELDESLESIFLFPNPNTINGNIIINTPTSAYNQLVIYNGNGQLIYKKSVSYSDQIVLSNPIQSSGMYFVRLEMDDKPISEWEKLIVH